MTEPEEASGPECRRRAHIALVDGAAPLAAIAWALLAVLEEVKAVRLELRKGRR